MQGKRSDDTKDDTALPLSLQAWDMYPHVPLVRVPLRPYAALREGATCETVDMNPMFF